MKPRMLVPVVIILLAGAAFAYLFIANRSGTPQPVQLRETPVIMARNTIKRGTYVKDEKVFNELFEIKRLPEQAVQPNMIREGDKQTVINRAIIVEVPAQSMLLKAQVNEKEGPFSLAAEVPVGMRLFTINVSVDAQVGGFVEPGSRVDIFATLNDGGQDIVLPLLQNILVWAKGTETGDEDAKKKEVKTSNNVTFLVTPEQLQSIMLMEGRSRFKFGLRGKLDDKLIVPDPLNVRKVLQLAGLVEDRERAGPVPEQAFLSGMLGFLDQLDKRSVVIEAAAPAPAGAPAAAVAVAPPEIEHRIVFRGATGEQLRQQTFRGKDVINDSGITGDTSSFFYPPVPGVTAPGTSPVGPFMNQPVSPIGPAAPIR